MLTLYNNLDSRVKNIRMKLRDTPEMAKGVGRPMSIPDQGFTARLRDICEARGITTPAEFADFLGVSRAVGHNWWNGAVANVSAKVLFKIADAVDCNPRWLLTGHGPKAAAFKPRSETELRIINAYRVSSEGERAIVDAWLEVQEKIHTDRLQNEVLFNRRGKHQ